MAVEIDFCKVLRPHLRPALPSIQRVQGDSFLEGCEAVHSYLGLRLIISGVITPNPCSCMICKATVLPLVFLLPLLVSRIQSMTGSWTDAVNCVRNLYIFFLLSLSLSFLYCGRFTGDFVCVFIEA